MIYDIQMKNDISSGAVLVIRFPEDEIDKKALYTIQSDQPDFLVPFFLRNVDGYAECTYQLGARSALRYRFGSHPAKEYVNLWTRVLQPLLDCEDWFLKPLSFVLDANYLYADRTGTVVSYIYVPSKTDCVEASTLKDMVSELANKNSTDDQRLENRVWRALAQDFQPRNFLQMLTAEIPSQGSPPMQGSAVYPHPNVYPNNPQKDVLHQAPMPKKPPMPTPAPPQPKSPNDIEIVIDDRQKPKKVGLFGGKKDKQEKKDKKQEKKAEKKGLFGSKSKKNQEEIVLGPAGEPAQYTPQKQSYLPEPFPVPGPVEDADDVTRLSAEDKGGTTHLRLVGDSSLPRTIPVSIQPGQEFTIGRFDVSVGHKQSDFEFDRRTEAVSRHHAVIERSASGEYFIKDLVSTAGTLLNGVKLTPNVSYPLTRNDKIGFGTSGADYVWEE